MRDYLKWHDAYEDPDSHLSWRLRQAQTYIRQALDHLQRPGTVLSLCAGDGRDVLHVLADRDDSVRYDGPPRRLATGRQLFAFLQ